MQLTLDQLIEILRGCKREPDVAGSTPVCAEFEFGNPPHLPVYGVDVTYPSGFGGQYPPRITIEFRTPADCRCSVHEAARASKPVPIPGQERQYIWTEAGQGQRGWKLIEVATREPVMWVPDSVSGETRDDILRAVRDAHRNGREDRSAELLAGPMGLS